MRFDDQGNEIQPKAGAPSPNKTEGGDNVKSPMATKMPVSEPRKYKIDNSILKVPNRPGVAYRFSKSLVDKVKEAPAKWNDVVEGIDEGDGWLKVGHYYLPMKYDGIPVITPITAEEAERLTAMPPSPARAGVTSANKGASSAPAAGSPPVAGGNGTPPAPPPPPPTTTMSSPSTGASAASPPLTAESKRAEPVKMAPAAPRCELGNAPFATYYQAHFKSCSPAGLYAHFQERRQQAKPQQQAETKPAVAAPPLLLSEPWFMQPSVGTWRMKPISLKPISAKQEPAFPEPIKCKEMVAAVEPCVLEEAVTPAMASFAKVAPLPEKAAALEKGALSANCRPWYKMSSVGTWMQPLPFPAEEPESVGGGGSSSTDKFQ